MGALMGAPMLRNPPVFRRCSPSVSSSYSGLRQILSTLSGIPYTSGEVSVLPRLERLAGFPLP